MDQLKAISEGIERRRAIYNTFVCRTLPDISPIKVPQVIGHYSRTDTQGKNGERARYIVKYDCVTVGGLIETPTTAARDYLKANGYKPKKMRGPIQYESINRIVNRFSQTPGFCSPGPFADGEYIDIRAAFYSIMCIAGWDLVYSPGRVFGRGRSVKDFPFPQNKVSRNSMASAAQVAEFVIANPPGGNRNIKVQRRTTELTNLQLIAIISDVLHSIAALAQRAGARYGNVDGYIAGDHATAERIKTIIADFGLSYGVKFSGPGVVNSVGSYRIGGFKTANCNSRGVGVPSSNVIDIDYLRWLQKNFSFAAARL